MNADPRIIRLAGEAEYSAKHHNPYQGVVVSTDRELKQICLTALGRLPVDGYVGDEVTTYAYLTLETLDELLRDLLAARADLLKLNGGK